MQYMFTGMVMGFAGFSANNTRTSDDVADWFTAVAGPRECMVSLPG